MGKEKQIRPFNAKSEEPILSIQCHATPGSGAEFYSLGGGINAYSKMTFVETIKIDNPKKLTRKKIKRPEK